MQGKNISETPTYIDEYGVSKITGRSVSTLRSDRHYRRGIPYIKINGRMVRYSMGDVVAFMEANRVDPQAAV